jgi:hypothetical protein
MALYGWIYIADGRDLEVLAGESARTLGYDEVRRRGDCLLFGEEDEHCVMRTTRGAFEGGEAYPRLLLVYDQGVNAGDVMAQTFAAYQKLSAAGIGPLLVVDELTEKVLRGKRLPPPRAAK